MSYRVLPGLYALNSPGASSPVLVTASYKMSFDRLRSALPGRDAWILVLDTQGVNVWCAAGKGTFGTSELINRLNQSGLVDLVSPSNRQVIVPQLGAPGVAAHKIKKATGFKAVFGPIRAEDLPAFLDSGGTATAQMRRKRFPMSERAALIPIELVAALKVAIPGAAILALVAGLASSSGFWIGVGATGGVAAIALLAAVIAGSIATPLLLPWLPGRAFSVKGMMAGLLAAAVVTPGLLWQGSGDGLTQALETTAWLLLIPALSSFQGMCFTGASTYTSLSGVRKEMRWAVPLQIGAAVIGLGLWVGAVWHGAG
jgi:acetyl-CoA decarbonylase/synthase complex subunit gamma